MINREDKKREKEQIKIKNPFRIENSWIINNKRYNYPKKVSKLKRNQSPKSLFHYSVLFWTVEQWLNHVHEQVYYVSLLLQRLDS